MLEPLLRYFQETTTVNLLRDLVDVGVVYYLSYRIFLVARGTRAVPIGLGLAVVGLLYVVAEQLRLRTVETLVRIPLESILIVSVVIFQSDIRRALERMGSRPWVASQSHRQETELIDEIVDAARELARHRIGALITLEQDANLDEFVGNNRGIELDAKVSAELLVALFVPEGMNKLHDGSVVIRNLRIAKAGVFFPMPSLGTVDPSFGSRHRAAIGITEETDAVVVVVSEERGTISFCFNGNIASDLQAPQLREMLLSILGPKNKKKARTSARSRHPEAPEIPSEEAVSLDAPLPVTDPKAVASATASSVPLPLRKSLFPALSPEAQFEEAPDSHSREAPRPMPKAPPLPRIADSEEPPHE